MIHVCLLLDESGSMQPLRSDVVGGVNEYINRLKAEKDSELTRLTMFMFDRSGTEPILRAAYRNMPLEDAVKFSALSYSPRGATPLNDAVIEAMASMSRFVNPDDKVIFTIFTDGLENASTEATAASVKQAVVSREKSGWTFLYLGANQDAWQVGYQYGFDKRGQTYSTVATASGVYASMGTAANLANTMRRAGGQSVSSMMDMPTTIEEDEIDPDEKK